VPSGRDDHEKNSYYHLQAKGEGRKRRPIPRVTMSKSRRESKKKKRKEGKESTIRLRRGALSCLVEEKNSESCHDPPSRQGRGGKGGKKSPIRKHPKGPHCYARKKILSLPKRTEKDRVSSTEGKGKKKGGAGNLLAIAKRHYSDSKKRPFPPILKPDGRVVT